MAEESVGPDYLTTRGIPTSRRGYDKRVVDAIFSEARGHWQELVDRFEELQQAVEATGGMDFLGKELSVVGDEIGEVLASAQKAAEGIRTRSREETERLEREAAERVEALVAEAEQQAFDLRQDAWNGGMEALDSADAEAERIMRAAKDDALVIRAQAEKDSHRHIAGAEREAGDLIRQARYEADRQLNQARELAQSIIDRAATPQYVDSDAVQVRSPAVDAERDELLGEIDRIRLEQSIESVKVFENEPRLPEPDESVDPDGIDLSDVLAAEVEVLRADPVESGSSEPKPEVVKVSTTPPANQFGTEDDVGTLFEALRETDDGSTENEEQLPADPFDLRVQLLTPVVGEGGRDAKRYIVTLQNEALSGLRGSGWSPDPPSIGRELTRSLDTMVLKAASAGARAAGPLAGLRGAFADPGARPIALVTAMAAALVGQLDGAVEDGDGPEQAAEAVSRVLREWRDEAVERWVFMVAAAAYHDSLITAVRNGGIDRVQALMGDGPRHDDCPGPDGLAWRPGREPPNGMKVPPVSLECMCTLRVAATS